jgi:hypothetical protein
MSRIILFVILLFAGGYVSGQSSDCKVLIPAISGSYTGECKKGLANGKGVAQGIDHYEGHFSKGLPDGNGIYKWADGSYYDGGWKNGLKDGQGTFVKGDSTLTGIWKDDHYEGKKLTPPYKIISARNVSRYTISKSIESENGVKVKLLLGGRDNSEVDDFSMASSNGSEYRNMGIYGIQNSSVPVEVTIRYTTWNQLHSVQYEVLFEFTITAPGTWNVTLSNM